MLYANEKRPRVVTFWQLVAIVVMFASILYFLHTDKKSFYEKLLTSENSNYDLTAIYLRNILNMEPENAKYLYEFSNVMIKKGDYDMAETTLAALESLPSNNPLKKKAIVLEYKLFKQQYYMTKDPKIRRTLLQKMTKIYRKIITDPSFDRLPISKMKRWLDESWFLKRPDFRLMILAKMVAKEPQNAKLNEDLLQLALAQKRKNLALKALENLAWNLDRLKGKEYARRLSLLVDGYRAVDESKKAQVLLIHAFEKQKDPRYLFKAIEMLIWSGDYTHAVALGKKYENILIQSRANAKKLLDLYLQAGRVNEARRLSLKLLKRFGR